MLILTRKKNQEILIGDQIVITVLDLRGDRVRLGFVAPKKVPIRREEVVRRNATSNGNPGVDSTKQ